MLPQYTVKVELRTQKWEDLFTTSGFNAAINLANNKIFSFASDVKSVRIIRHGSHPGNDSVVASWSKGRGWSYVRD